MKHQSVDEVSARWHLREALKIGEVADGDENGSLGMPRN